MSIKSERPLKIFYAYDSKDEDFQQSLERHLAALGSQGYIIGWSKSCIDPGRVLEAEIDRNLEISDIILLLISADFIASKQCCKQMDRALAMHKIGKTRVVPIILRPVAWKVTQIGKLQVLPRNEIPISQWRNHDQAFAEIVDEIGTIATGLINGIDEEIFELLKDFNRYYFQMEMTDEAWVTTILDRQSYLSNSFFTLQKIEALIENASSTWWADMLTLPALLFIEQKVSGNYPKHVKNIFRSIFGYRGHDDFDDFRSYEANLVSRYYLAKIALKRASKVLRQDPNNTQALYIKSVALTGLGRNEEALNVAESVQKLDPHFPYIWDLESVIFAHLRRIEEALNILEQAVRLNPDDAEDYKKVKITLESLRKPARWLRLTLPPQKETLTLPQFAESLFLSQATGEVSTDLGELGTVEQDGAEWLSNLDIP